ncbi:MAG TPA: N-acyl homoserine lactonase family protein [Geminicoccaceae bacterium]|nr:N-acyl homoserine lactonase family protein [Geminicoccaceae bacterium]
MSPATYELFAVKYAEFSRPAVQNFTFAADVHDGPMPLDYFTWIARSPERTFVIDTGFDEATGGRRARSILRDPSEGCAALDVDTARIEDVIVTHLHYDHAGNPGAFRRARFHLQDREMAYATGRHMCHGRLRMPFDVEHVVDMLREVYRGRVAFHAGDVEIASGISLHLVGGHSDGLQVVRVHTRRGWVVVASDAIHFYANMETGNPFPIVFNVGDMMEGWNTCRRLADSEQHIVPGHDPLVMQRYPAPSAELEGIAVRLDVPPRI